MSKSDDEILAELEAQGIHVTPLTNFAGNVALEAPLWLNNVSVDSGTAIGRYTTVGQFTKIFRKTSIGRYCSIGNNCSLGASRHPLDWLSTSTAQFAGALNTGDLNRHLSFASESDTSIGNDVWAGANVVVATGVRIGDGAVIGAGAVVTGDVAPYEIVGGVPARRIRFRFPPALVERLLRARWWDLDVAQVKELPFDDIEACLRRIEGADLPRAPQAQR